MSEIIITKTGRYKLVKIEEPVSETIPTTKKQNVSNGNSKSYLIFVIIGFGIALLFVLKYLEGVSK